MKLIQSLGLSLSIKLGLKGKHICQMDQEN